MSPTHYTEFEVSCPSCGRRHMLTLTDDIPLCERITCSSCNKDMAKVGDLIAQTAKKQPATSSSSDDASQPAG